MKFELTILWMVTASVFWTDNLCNNFQTLETIQCKVNYPHNLRNTSVNTGNLFSINDGL